MATTSESGSDEIILTVEKEPWALIPDSRYEVIRVRHDIRRYMGGQKLYVVFKVVTCGPHLGTLIYRAYNFDKDLSTGMDLYKDLVLLYGSRVRKNARLSLSLFQNKVLVVQTRTVKKDRKQGDLAEYQRYSVVDRIVSVAVGGGSGAV